MIQEFKKLAEGIKRAIIAGSFIVAGIAPFFFGANYQSDLDDSDYWEPFIWIFIIYWILVIVGLWIYSGFKSKK